MLVEYDRDYLGENVSDLGHLNAHLIGFLQHDRITMAATIIGVGIFYLVLAQAMRQGFRWARRVLAISGAVTFGSYFYFLGTGGFVEPLHTRVLVILTPPLVIAISRRPTEPHWPAVVEGPAAVLQPGSGTATNGNRCTELRKAVRQPQSDALTAPGHETLHPRPVGHIAPSWIRG